MTARIGAANYNNSKSTEDMKQLMILRMASAAAALPGWTASWETWEYRLRALQQKNQDLQLLPPPGLLPLRKAWQTTLKDQIRDYRSKLMTCQKSSWRDAILRILQEMQEMLPKDLRQELRREESAGHAVPPERGAAAPPTRPAGQCSQESANSDLWEEETQSSEDRRRRQRPQSQRDTTLTKSEKSQNNQAFEETRDTYDYPQGYFSMSDTKGNNILGKIPRAVKVTFNPNDEIRTMSEPERGGA